MTDIKNYKPISLLNNDYRIYMKILAERLKRFLMEYIKEEQMGFLPGKQIKDDIRMVVNIVEYYVKLPGKEMMFCLVPGSCAAITQRTFGTLRR